VGFGELRLCARIKVIRCAPNATPTAAQRIGAAPAATAIH